MTESNTSSPYPVQQALPLNNESFLPQSTVLIVDDNPQNVELLQAFLESLPVRIVSAVDGPITLGDFGQPHQDGACDHEGQCVLIAVWNEAGEYMRHQLDSYTLAMIADIARGGAPWPATGPVSAVVPSSG